MAITTTGDCLKLDIPSLRRLGYLKRNQITLMITLRWGEHSSIGCDVYTATDTTHIKLKYNRNGEQISYEVPLTTTKPHYGGERWWFICPFSNKRCATLYLPPGQKHFAARTAFKHLPYTSQNETSYDRAARKYRKVAKKYGAEWNQPFFDKPKGMHEKTHSYAVRKLTELDETIDIEFFKHVGYLP